MQKNQKLFVFDVESIGIHGEAFAVAGGIYHLADNTVFREFCFACPTEEAFGAPEDRKWVQENIPPIEQTHSYPINIRHAFWQEWEAAKKKYPKILMAAECAWPVEARFLNECIDDEPKRNWGGPYPLIDISTYMLAAGMDPMASYERLEGEEVHHPLGDVRQSVRLLWRAWSLSQINQEYEKL